MIITVAICTWNRCQLLRQALAAMTELVIPSDVTWELLIVNNNCTDNTDEMIASFSEQLPIRRIFEPKPGKSYALNTAVKEAIGEYILWTDDDAKVDRDWMAMYCQAFQKWPDAAFFGGPAFPIFKEQPPEWLRQSWNLLRSHYACPDYGSKAIPLRGEQLPYGLNFAIKTNDQKKFFYNEQIGPQPSSEIRAEDFELVRKMLLAGATGYWIPEAKVSHFIPAERMTLKWIWKRAYGSGVAQALLSESENCPMLFGKPRWVWRKVVESELTYWFSRIFLKPDIWIRHLITAGITWGVFSYYKGHRDR